jgi:hypothetical protein
MVLPVRVFTKICMVVAWAKKLWFWPGCDFTSDLHPAQFILAAVKVEVLDDVLGAWAGPLPLCGMLDLLRAASVQVL